MNPTTATLISGAAFILAIFGASWLNQQAMNKRIDDLKFYIDARFNAMERELKAHFSAVDARFEAVDARFNAVDQRLSAVEQRMERLERQLEAIFKPILPKN
jgi:septation ring formation regulator EzrA